MIQTMYKVVTKSYRTRGYVSSVTGGKAKVNYIPHEWSTAQAHMAEAGYHLLVFDNYREADVFSLGHDSVWTCHVSEEVELPPILISAKLDAAKILGATWPSGTRMFKKVKLLAQVR